MYGDGSTSWRRQPDLRISCLDLEMGKKGDGKGGGSPPKPIADASKAKAHPPKALPPKASESSNSGMYIMGAVGVILAMIGAIGFGMIKAPGSPQSVLKTSKNIGGTTEFVGNKTYYPSFGLFPKDCKWRPVSVKGKSGFEYVWWVCAQGRETMPACGSIEARMCMASSRPHAPPCARCLSYDEAADCPLV